MDRQRRVKQAWTIARIELRRAFFSRRALWVYGLALFPAVIFFFYNLSIQIRRSSLQSGSLTTPALIDSIRIGERDEDILARLGKTKRDYRWQSNIRVRDKEEKSGITTHKIDPAYEARYVRLNIMVPTCSSDRTTRIYEFEVYGPDGATNLALHRPVTGSTPCSADEGPEKAVNGSVSGGTKDRWCSHEPRSYLQVDLGEPRPIGSIVIRHASAGGESAEFDTCRFSVQATNDNKIFATVVGATGTRLVEEITWHRNLVYFDGRREVQLNFTDGRLTAKNAKPLVDFEEDRKVFAGVFQFFYLRLAIFFGCLGIFMNLFRGEMLDKTLHFWFLAPARREVLLAGKYGAGLIASSVIFGFGTLACIAVMLSGHSSAEVQQYWQSVGQAHLFWYTAAAVLGCIGYGSVFVAAGLLLRNPIIPAAVLLAWESVNGFLPALLQKLSILYYLQSLCPVPAPVDADMPALLRLLLAPAAPASKAGAVIGLLAVTAVVLWLAALAIRRIQISYSTET